MPTFLEFPEMLIRAQQVQWDLVSHTISGGPASGGAWPLVATDGGGLWKAILTNVPLLNRTAVLAWRAISTHMDGGKTPVVVPMCDIKYYPGPIVEGKLVAPYGNIPHDDDAMHDDGAGYYQPTVVAVVDVEGALRDTELVIDMQVGQPIEAGQYFSLEHVNLGWRLYRIASATENEDGTTTVGFRPPLRESIAEGNPVEFDHPRCVMRLTDPGGMNLPLDVLRNGMPSVSFIETYFPPV